MKGVWLLPVVATPLALIIFIQGFLPLKVHNEGFASEQCCDKPVFKKVVLMVVDALKAEFMIKQDSVSADWAFVKKSVADGKAIMFKAKAHPPTVTLPRIKALISGDIPGFVDVIMNFDSAELKSDNLLHQLKAAGRSSIFYGDDTWLRLFPSTFERSEGTTSFFVSDYTEVDNNVTRHLGSELQADDWTLMILHYLGLDHIGHLIGPTSSLVLPKLQEMDAIVRLIVESLNNQGQSDYLVIVCGDHGMADQGGHGGVTPNEVSTPMLFITDHNIKQPETVENIYQIDFVPTLASLLNLPIPRPNLGVTITGLLGQLLTPSQLLKAVRANCDQLMELIYKEGTKTVAERSLARYKLLQSQYMAYNRSGEHDSQRISKLINEYKLLMTEIRDGHASSLVDYDVPAMITGCVMIVTILLVQFCTLVEADTIFYLSLPVVGAIVMPAYLVHCTSQSAGSVLCKGYTGLAAALTQTLMLSVCVTRCMQLKGSILKSLPKFDLPCFIMISFTVVHSLSLLASSFIEEEHQIAYFYSTSLVICVFLFSLIKSSRRGGAEQVFTPLWRARADKVENKNIIYFLSALVCMTIARKWNQTGDKWSHLSDIADWLNIQEHWNLKFLVVTLSLALIILLTVCNYNSSPFQYKWLDYLAFSNIITMLSGMATLLFVLQDMGIFSVSERGIYEANVVYVSSGTLLVLFTLNYAINGFSHYDRIHLLPKSWILLTLILHRPVNIPVMMLTLLTEHFVSRIREDDNLLLVSLYYWLGQASFFYQGNSNSLSTVDVSAGYKGMSGYQPVVQGFLMMCNTYSGPIFWLLCLFGRLRHTFTSRNYHVGATQHITWFYLTMKLCDMAMLQFLIIIERYHLFVWTVFAPKLLYEVAWLSIVLFFHTFTTGLGDKWTDLDTSKLKMCCHEDDHKISELICRMIQKEEPSGPERNSGEIKSS